MISAVPKTEAGPAPAAVPQLVDLVHEVLQGSLRQLHPTLTKEGITMGQFWAIRTVSSLRTASLSTAARYLGLSSPALCASVDQLEKAGLVRRHRSERDRRVVELSLTPRGRQVQTRIWREIARVMTEAGRGLDAEDVAAAVRVFREVARRLESDIATRREGP
ncbi:MAG TPA: MarR family transcriptional regulator [Thermoplasmata archaeon]|jgi:DNA-binding MarR family transcriptional regulator|nr:MarR family transcriptional regulator [Thermoplasmata archaeon]HYB78817.1 MarR family transcriptional regulator [Thermoplasmata archaeon]